MVVPEILADSKSGKQLVKELGAMAFGISWYVLNSLTRLHNSRRDADTTFV